MSVESKSLAPAHVVDLALGGSNAAAAVTVQLSAHWAFSTAALGLFIPYFSLFLREDVGLSATDTGLVLAVPPLVGLVSQPLWGQFADRTGSRVRALTLLGVGAAIGYAALPWASGFALTALLCGLHAVFLSALFPMLVSVSLAALVPNAALGFGRVRMWGTIGYLFTVVGAPWLVEHAPWLPVHTGKPGLAPLFYLGALLTLIGAACAKRLPRTQGLELRATVGDTRGLLRQGPYLRLLAFTTGATLFLNAPMMLFPLYVRAHGGGVADVSHLWIWMLLLEIPLVARSGALFERLGPERTLVLATLAGGVRWLVCGISPSLFYVYPVQILHGFVVAGLGIGGTLYAERLVPPQLRSTAQTTLVVAGSSIGGMLSTTLGGALVDTAGVDALYLTGGLGAICFSLLGSQLLPRDPTRA